MSLDLSSLERIVGSEIYESGIQTGMSAMEAERQAVLQRAATVKLDIDELARLRQLELKARDVRTTNEKNADELKKIYRVQGLQIAAHAIDYLLDAPNAPGNFNREFHIGHIFREANDGHNVQHSAYLGRLSLLVNNGTLAYSEDLQIYRSLPTGRSIQRVDDHISEEGEIGIVRYIGMQPGETPASLGAIDEAMRLIAEA